MDALKGLLEVLKNNTYELLALLLPGGALVELLKNLFPAVDQQLGHLMVGEGKIKYLVLIYVVGTALQGVARLLASAEAIQSALHIDRRALDPLRDRALTALGVSLSAETRRAAAGLCLSAVDTKRGAYDRFSALRDMARGLALTMAAGLFALIVAIAVKTIIPDGNTLLLAVGLAFAFGGFLNGYARFSPLAEEAVYTQVIVMKLPATPAPVVLAPVVVAGASGAAPAVPGAAASPAPKA